VTKRKDKQQVEVVVKDKFKEERRIAALQPKTEAQKKYIHSLKTNIISIGTGHAGSGKTFCPTYLAAQMINGGQIDKIYITRPYAHLGKDAGAVPGTDTEKLEPFVRPMLDTLKKTLGEGKYQYLIDKKQIEVAPLEKIQGRSFDEKCVIIVDEAQNATKPQMISLVTRIGEGVVFLAIAGDPRQSIKSGENALDWLTSFFTRNNIGSVGITQFTEKDCVRSGIVRDILVAFEKEGGFYTKLGGE
jgi:phosphate starvation-inducible protein PhoH and related proteins